MERAIFEFDSDGIKDVVVYGGLSVNVDADLIADVYAHRVEDELQLKVQRVWLSAGGVGATLKADADGCLELARSAWEERAELWSVALAREEQGWRCMWSGPARRRGYRGPIASYAALLEEDVGRFKRAEAREMVAQAKRLKAAQQAWLRAVWREASCGAEVEGGFEVIAWPSGRMMAGAGEGAGRACLERALRARQGPEFAGGPAKLDIFVSGAELRVSGVSSCAHGCEQPTHLPSSRRLMAPQLWAIAEEVGPPEGAWRDEASMASIRCMVDGYEASRAAQGERSSPRRRDVLWEPLRLCALRWGRVDEVKLQEAIGARPSHVSALSAALARWSGEDITGLLGLWAEASRADEWALAKLFAREQELPLELRFAPRFLEARARFMLWLEPQRTEDVRSLLQLAVWLAASSEAARHQRALDALGPGEAPAAALWQQEREEHDREGKRIAARYKELMQARAARVEEAWKARGEALKAALRKRDEEERRVAIAQRSQAHERRSNEAASERARLGWMVLAVAVAAVILLVLLVRREGRR